MNNNIFRWHRSVAALALLMLTCGTPLQAWCGNSNLWTGLQSDGIESFTSGQLKQSGTPSPVQLNTSPPFVLGLAFDKSQNLWADSDFKVMRFTRKQLKDLKNNPNPNPGVIITSTSSLNDIRGCNFDRNGNLWVVDVGADSLNELTKAQLAAGSGDITPAIVITLSGLQNPTYVTFDKGGNAWVDNVGEGITGFAEFSASQLKSSGTKTPAVLISDDGSGTLSNLGQIAFDKKGNLWIPSYDSDIVVEYAKNQLGNSGNPSPAVKLSSAIFDGPGAAVFDSKGNLLITNINSGTIAKFTPDQLTVSGAPIPKIVVTAPQTNQTQITFGPAF
jgi:hypothetical protein